MSTPYWNPEHLAALARMQDAGSGAPPAVTTGLVSLDEFRTYWRMQDAMLARECASCGLSDSMPGTGTLCAYCAELAELQADQALQEACAPAAVPSLALMVLAAALAMAVTLLIYLAAWVIAGAAGK